MCLTCDDTKKVWNTILGEMNCPDCSDGLPSRLDECEPGEHVFEMEGPPPWRCTFCGYTPELVK